jgi:hypothetical protein
VGPHFPTDDVPALRRAAVTPASAGHEDNHHSDHIRDARDSQSPQPTSATQQRSAHAPGRRQCSRETYQALAASQPPAKRKAKGSLAVCVSKRRANESAVDKAATYDAAMRTLDLTGGRVLDGFDSSPPQALAAAVLSRGVFAQWLALVRTWRARTLPLRWECSGDAAITAAQLHRNAQLLEGRTASDAFLARLTEYQFAATMDQERFGERHDSTFVDRVLQELGLDANVASRKTLLSRLSRWRKWVTLCGDLGPGLLSLIPTSSDAPYFISSDACRKMDLAGIEAFQVAVEVDAQLLQTLCDTGLRIAELHKDTAEFEFGFEFAVPTSDMVCVDKYPPASLLSLFTPVSYPNENIYPPTRQADWDRPDDWPLEWSWPADPSSVRPDRQCDWCEKPASEPCSCIRSLPQDRHRIAYYAAKGRGVRAYGPSPGSVVFVKDEYIGELVGELLPLASHDDGMAIEFSHPDIQGSPPVCELYCKSRSNWLRLVNHACSPCARYEVACVSGRVRMLLRAVQDIVHGMEITTDYGSVYRSKLVCLCERCARKHC